MPPAPSGNRFQKRGFMDDYLAAYLAKTPASARLYERARRVMPGGVSHNPRYFSPYPVYIKAAAGAKIWDADGNEYVDLWMGHYAHILGYQPKPIVTALSHALERGTHWGIVNELQVAFAEDICRLVPGAEQMRFGISGTEATMYAVRLARAYTQRPVIIKIRGGWHGANSDLLASIHAPMDGDESAGLAPGYRENLVSIPFNDPEEALHIIHSHASHLAGVILEAVGQHFIPPEPGFLAAVAAETRKAGGIFIMDEVITGFRLGLTGAQGYFGLTADLITLGKVLGGGMPMGVVAGRRDIMSLADPTLPRPKGTGVLIGGGTFSGLIPSLIAGHTMLKYLEENQQWLYPSLEEKGKRLREGIAKAFQARGIPVRTFGIGSLVNTCFPYHAEEKLKNIEDVDTKTDTGLRDQRFRLSLINSGVYTKYGGGAVSLAHSDADIALIIAAAQKAALDWPPKGE
jgi:glutamate-1-semialdehyde 2,1-aminomutase